jgi:exopolyphosphatase/pppGpp-phosphohydrolase
LFLDYSKAPPDERAARIGVSQAHGNLIPAGYAILSTAMTILGVDAVVPSGRGVAEGLLFETTKAHEPPGR